MKKITDILTQKNKLLSFELFPPKTEKGYQNLIKNIAELVKLQPNFISVTYGAGGSSKMHDKTKEIVLHIQKEYKITALPHLTCIGNNETEMSEIIKFYYQNNIKNILALRGDPPKDNPDWIFPENSMKYSYELVEFIRKKYNEHFSIGVAGFPEGHIDCPNLELDTQYLKKKIDSGADFVITQLFFQNSDYFSYVKRLRKLGVENKIIPGILPIVNYQGAVSFCERCGTTVPPKVHELFEPYKDDKEKTMQLGIEYAINQCRELLENGAPGIHFYPLNKLEPTKSIVEALKKIFF